MIPCSLLKKPYQESAKRGGRTVVYHCASHKMHRTPLNINLHFWIVWSLVCTILCLLTTKEFFSQSVCSCSQEKLATYNSLVIIIGNSNIHLEDLKLLDSQHSRELLLQFSFRQIVNKPTQALSVMFDLFIICDDNPPPHSRHPGSPPTILDINLVAVSFPLGSSTPLYLLRMILNWIYLTLWTLASLAIRLYMPVFISLPCSKG